MSKKLPPRPAWQKKTDFWIAAALGILAIVGMIQGDSVISDPGQKREGHLFVWYFFGGLAMFVNGWISHRQALQHYDEAVEAAGGEAANESAEPEPVAEEPAPEKED